MADGIPSTLNCSGITVPLQLFHWLYYITQIIFVKTPNRVFFCCEKERVIKWQSIV
nr:MAG TPA: hypothetical protein [Caudoviricetes sp.]